jgi:hypothetical protein
VNRFTSISGATRDSARICKCADRDNSFAKDIAMSRLFATIAVAVFLVSLALAQSTDTSVGSGNTAQQLLEDNSLSASAYRELQLRNDIQGRTVLPYTLQEHRAFERAKGSIW